MKLNACNLKSHSITTTTPLPSLFDEMGFYLDISGNQDATVKLKSRLIFYRFFYVSDVPYWLCVKGMYWKNQNDLNLKKDVSNFNASF